MVLCFAYRQYSLKTRIVDEMRLVYFFCISPIDFFSMYTLGRVELDADANHSALGVIVDVYGDECGESLSNNKGLARDVEPPISSRTCRSFDASKSGSGMLPSIGYHSHGGNACGNTAPYLLEAAGPSQTMATYVIWRTSVSHLLDHGSCARLGHTPFSSTPRRNVSPELLNQV